MPPGDLNLKKSWHPGLAKNQAKVKQREEEALKERQKAAERQKEIASEQYEADLLKLQGKQASKLGWMYRDGAEQKKGGLSDATKEDYLLGKKRVDEQFFEQFKKTKQRESMSRQELQKTKLDPMAAIIARKKRRDAKKTGYPQNPHRAPIVLAMESGRNSVKVVGTTSDHGKFALLAQQIEGDAGGYVTPEAVALKIADRIIHFFPEIETAIDLCSGAGGNSIAFARCGFQTIAVDVDPAVHIDAQHNSHVYGVYNIEYVQGSATKVPLSELADPATTIVFSSPEWGGPIYKNQETFDVEVCRPRVSEIIEHAHSQGFNRIVLFLPRTSNLNQLADMGAKYIDYMFQGTWCTAMCAWWC
ncbi:Trimethylguanosine synthase [Wickerhamiella sorbophila]|uniref:Pre-mRNA-splicing factor CWC25 n=1 Tax=Wickerhamiella sorbophila TaxID=45607 RepID=A0A2T0FG13_9ASCO|nr:Trimethylguanosine synthase [Wickerhamiella sorbophila]PRT53899.1 Trimethylguanosine synthase [Wickerhamiella sorbophila]